MTQEQPTAHFTLPQPTFAVPIPTRGLYYDPGHPLFDKSFVEIRQMTTKDEEILTNESLIKQGVALDKMLQGLFFDSRIKLSSLYLGDKNAVVIAARKENYSTHYEASVTCPSCGNTSSEVFDLEECLIPKVLDEDDPASEIEIEPDGSFTIVIPKELIDATPLVEIGCRLLNGADEKSLSMSKQKKKKHKLKEAPIRDLFKKMIVSIAGDDSTNTVKDFVDNLPTPIANYIRRTYEKVVPNVDLKREFNCERCRAETVIRIPFTARFFWAE